MQNSLNDYKNNGFFLFKNCVDVSFILELQSKVRNVFKNFCDGSDKGIIDLYKNNKSCYVGCAKACHNIPEIYLIYSYLKNVFSELNINCPLYNMRPVLHFSSKFTSSHDFYWKANPHQDWYGMRGSLDGVVLWIPIFDIKKDHGFLELSPGSHKAGLQEHKESGPTFEILNTDERVFSPIPCAVGDALCFSAFTIHRSGLNVTDSIRMVVSLRFDNSEEDSFVEKVFPQSFNYVRNDISTHYNKEKLDAIFT